MMRRGRILLFAIALSAGAEEPEFVSPAGVEFSATEVRRLLQHSPLPPVPKDATNRVAEDPRAAAFGEKLFFDQRLSRDGTVSCATCHDPALGFADGRALPKGLGDGPRHTPGLWNVAHNRWYFWDGRADTLWSQALQPLERDIEMGLPRADVANVIRDDVEYARRYAELFGSNGVKLGENGKSLIADEDEQVFVNVGKAIAAYERTLISDDSPFDSFVAGLQMATRTGAKVSTGESAEALADKPPAAPASGGKNNQAGYKPAPQKSHADLNALSVSAQRGAKLFVGRGDCRACHSGPNFTDNEFHTVRVPPRENAPVSDAGRYAGVHALLQDDFRASGVHSDDREGVRAKKLQRLRRSAELWGLFKTPSLRNVELTAPYMHQGQFATLRDVLHHYSTFENALPPGHHEQEITLQPLQFSAQETADLLAFLESLTGREARRLAAKVVGVREVEADSK